VSDTEVLGALDGVRIVDLTQMLAGPYCTMLLADQGAEVIKVEPLDGDHTRIIGPYHADDRLKAFGGYFASVNRNKKSIAIDLKTEAGRDLVLKLCDNADAVVENYRGGVMDRLGLSYETLHARNPKLVYATIRGPARAPIRTSRPTMSSARQWAGSWPSPAPTRTRR
jgi:crotonobetainyl-CoA:carnitine CoA-transferase CaiB-like acyl-CoA transferase